MSASGGRGGEHLPTKVEIKEVGNKSIFGLCFPLPNSARRRKSDSMFTSLDDREKRKSPRVSPLGRKMTIPGNSSPSGHGLMAPMLEQVKGRGGKIKKLFTGEKEKTNKVWESKGNLIFGPKSECQSQSSTTTPNSKQITTSEVSSGSFRSSKSNDKSYQSTKSPIQSPSTLVPQSPVGSFSATQSPRSTSHHSPNQSLLVSHSPSPNPSAERHRKVIIRKADGTTTTRILKPGEELPKNVKKTPVRTHRIRRQSLGSIPAIPLTEDDISPQPVNSESERARQSKALSTPTTSKAAGKMYRRTSLGTIPRPSTSVARELPVGPEPKPKSQEGTPKVTKPRATKPSSKLHTQQSPVQQTPLTPGLTPRQRYRRATMSHVTTAGVPITPAILPKRTVPRSPKMPTVHDIFDTTQWPETPSLRAASSELDGAHAIILSDTIDIATAKLPITRLYKYARQCNWEAVSCECKLYPRDAKCVEPSDGTTALHLAVMSRINPLLREGSIPDVEMAPLELIEQLVAACPEAAITRCSVKKYTPLIYACLVLGQDYDLHDGVAMVRSLLQHAPHSVYVFTDDGFSALDVHILSYSRFHRDKQDCEDDSTLVMQALLEERPDLAEARSYKNRVRGPLELLYRSNLEHFKDSSKVSDFSPLSALVDAPQEWWAWRWADVLLRQHNNSSEYKSLHAACGLTGCPLPILLIAAQSNPAQLKEPVNELGNLPLHQVCMWICDSEMIAGDPFVLRRKTAAIESLLQLYPEAARIKNNMGETPLQLAIESKTPFHGGLEALIRAFGDALSIPRKLRAVDDENEQLLSVDVYDDNESVDSDWVDPVLAVEGMYPFMVAAVVSFIPLSKRRPSFFLNQTEAQHQADLEKRELENLRTIYGLLRARPSVFGQYKPVFRKKKSNQMEEPELSEYTEIVEDDSDYTEVTYDD